MHTWFGRESALVHLLSGDPAPAFEAAIEAVELEPSGVNAHLRLPGGRARRRLVARPGPAPPCARGDGARSGDVGSTRSAARRSPAWRRSRAAARTPSPGTSERSASGGRSTRRLDQAFCAADMAHVLPDEELTTEALAESTAFLTGIGAVSLLERIESARPSPAHAEVTGKARRFSNSCTEAQQPRLHSWSIAPPARFERPSRSCSVTSRGRRHSASNWIRNRSAV